MKDFFTAADWTHPPFSSLPEQVQKWIFFEQKINVRENKPLWNLKVAPDTVKLPSAYWPEAQQIFPLHAVFIPAHMVNMYGPYQQQLRELTTIKVPRGKVCVFIHPLAKRHYQKFLAAHKIVDTGLLMTPTASFRSLLVWHPNGHTSPFILKITLPILIGGINRRLSEQAIAKAVVMDQLFSSVTEREKKHFHFDYFAKKSGVVLKISGTGFALRSLPNYLSQNSKSTLLPFFSLYSNFKGRPLICGLIERSSKSALDFITTEVLQPLVQTQAKLLFEHGILHEAHSQNTLIELRSDGRLGRGIVVRDLGGAQVNVGLRLLLNKKLPAKKDMKWPAVPWCPQSLTESQFSSTFANINIEVHCFNTFIWGLGHFLQNYFPEINESNMRWQLLKLWQQETIEHLRIVPEIAENGARIALDETVEHLLSHHPWQGLTPCSRPPRPNKQAIPLLSRLLENPVTHSLSSDWGKLYFSGQMPNFLVGK